MVRRLLAVAVLLVSAWPVAAQDTWAAAEVEILRFLDAWNALWKESEAERHSLVYRAGAGGSAGFSSGSLPGGRERHASYGCFGGPAYPELPGRIPARGVGFGVCPSWLLGPIRDAADERFGIDGALTEGRRAIARRERDLLLRTLTAFAQSSPAEDWIVGALVRFHVDQDQHDEADAVAVSCGATPWWCASLGGYAKARRGDLVGASALYSRALAAMDQGTRCARTDYTALLDPAARERYARAGCGGRDSANAVLWWLADPLYSDSVNERWVEQQTRDVLVALRSAVERDERYLWRHEQGRAALSQMLTRYGPPSYSFWGGPDDERERAGIRYGVPNPPYTTYEYEPNRVHLVPAAGAVLDPFRAASSAWELNPPPGGTPPTLMGIWWPREHFAPPYPIVQLPDGQTAVLRRDAGALVAFATDLEPARLGWPSGTAIDDVVLVASPAPGSVGRVAHARSVAGAPLVIRGVVPPKPAVLGIEFSALGASGPPAGRVRFGHTPPPTLAQMRATDVAISEPVLLRAPSDGGDLPRDTTALDRLATSRRVRVGEKVGVYWETYGLAATDTVEVAVWVERYTRDGAMRRLGQSLRIATNRNTPVAVSWFEPQAGQSVEFVAAGVPVVTRSIVLDTSTLPDGEYWLDVAVRKQRGDAVRSRVSFSINR